MGRSPHLRLPGRRHQRRDRRASGAPTPASTSSQVRHEELAALMACAHAKFTGEVGVCLATSGPGAIHLLNGLYDAKLDHQPVVAIVGQQDTLGDRRRLPARGRLAVAVQGRCARVRADGDRRPSRCATSSTARCASRATERTVDLHHPAATTCRNCAAVPHAAARAWHRAFGHRPHGADESCPTRPTSQRAADVLNAGKRVAMLVGAGRAATPPTKSIEVAERARRRHRQGAARQGRGARRPALRHRRDRLARHASRAGT